MTQSITYKACGAHFNGETEEEVKMLAMEHKQKEHMKSTFSG